MDIRKKIATAMSVLVLAATLNGCTSDGDPTPEPAPEPSVSESTPVGMVEGQVVDTAVDGLGISLESDWLKFHGADDANYRLIGGYTDDNILISISELEEYEDFEARVEGISDNIFNEEKGREILEESDITQSGYDGKLWLYTDNSGFDHVLRILNFEDNKIVMIIGTTGEYLDELDAVVGDIEVFPVD